ncbi:hypothetical protein HYV43_01140 [Candidatus Micrarchaeota archaeon]|nr:hypothetical protein [Candidatus Micrarchaeota archaeon]
MNRRILVGLFGIAFVFAMALNVHGSSLTDVLVSSLLQSIGYFGILVLAAHAVKAFAERNIKMGFVFSLGTLSVGFAIFVLMGWFMPLCLTAITPAHFRTNTLTGACEYANYAGCVASDPWYYKKHCALTKDEKIELVRQSDAFEEIERICEKCQADSDSRCNKLSIYGLEREGITCQDIQRR